MNDITLSVNGAVNILQQSFSLTSIYRIELQNLSIQSHLQPFLSTFVLRMRRNRLFMNFRCKFRHCCSIPRSRFPIWLQNFSDLATFSVVYLHFKCGMSAIFLLPVCLTYWPKKYNTRVDPYVDIIYTKFKVDMTSHCRVIAFLTFWP